MKINLIKLNNSMLIASLHEDEEKLTTWKRNMVLQVEIKRERNPGFHRKFFALIGILFDNQEVYKNKKDLLVEIKLKAGHYEEHITTKGVIVYIPKSISFEAMDEMQFKIFYNKVIDVALEFFMPIDKAELDKMVDEVLRFA